MQIHSTPDNLRTILNELNMSQIDFARSVGTSYGYLNMVINGRRTSISRQFALLIEEKYGYSADWLLQNEGDKKIFPFKSHKRYKEMRTQINQLSYNEMKYLHKYILSLEERDENAKEKRKLKKQSRRFA
jgi:transcriptional regulator with XRE-family HTH domain